MSRDNLISGYYDMITTDLKPDETQRLISRLDKLSSKVEKMRREMKIKQGDFVDWYYNDGNELQGLAHTIISDLKSDGKSEITIGDLFHNNLGYLPENLIINKANFKDLLKNGELSEDDFDKVKVVWVKE